MRVDSAVIWYSPDAGRWVLSIKASKRTKLRRIKADFALILPRAFYRPQ